VPKFLKTVTLVSSPIFFATALANSIPEPIATTSISLQGLSKIISRTNPPIA